MGRVVGGRYPVLRDLIAGRQAHGIKPEAGIFSLTPHLAINHENAGSFFPHFREQSSRPVFVWENFEDLMYHDLEEPDAEIQTSPELFSFMGQVWVFNRAMRWIRLQPEGCVDCYSSGSRLHLTGENQVSKWHSDHAMRLSNRARTADSPSIPADGGIVPCCPAFNSI